MAHSEISGRARARRGLTFANRLWIAAASMVVAGFALRLVASVLFLPPLRLSGVVAIAAGLCAAALGWISERRAARRAP